MKPPGAFANTLTFAWRVLLKAKHMPEQMFDMIVTPIMFTVLFTFLFGGAIAGSPARYLQFLLPGILVQTVLFMTVYTGFTINQDISKGIYDRFRSMPIWKLSPLVGAMVGDTVRYTISGGIVVVVGVLLGYRSPAGILGVIEAIVLMNVFVLGFGWIFTTFALAVKSSSTVLTLSWLVMMPLTFASNVYVDPSTMPGWLQSFVAVNPVSHVTTAIRGIMAGTASLTEIALTMLASVVVTLICLPIAVWLYGRRV